MAGKVPWRRFARRRHSVASLQFESRAQPLTQDRASSEGLQISRSDVSFEKRWSTRPSASTHVQSMSDGESMIHVGAGQRPGLDEVDPR